MVAGLIIVTFVFSPKIANQTVVELRMAIKHFQNMRQHFFSLLILLLFSTYVFSQTEFKSTITGKIVDEDTRTPLLNVNIFLANTTIGAASGENGSFIIEFVPPGIYDLVVSMIGYNVKTFHVQVAHSQSYNFDIKLKSKPIEGDLVAVEAPNPQKWKKDLKKFKNLFLGESENAENCKILNPYVLDFAIDPDTREFIAFSDSTLLVENLSLGYLLKIVFQKFTYSPIKLTYGFFIQFEKLKPENEKIKNEWVNNRSFTYNGSFRHFLKSLVKGTLREDGFEVYETRSLLRHKTWAPVLSYRTKLLTRDSTNHVTKFRFNNFLGINYRGKPGLSCKQKRAVLSRESSFAELDSLGNLFSGYDLVKHWDWADERVADILPFDYVPQQ